ncbi:MAG: LPXTG cell wall anchor domain-containing protein [Faecousia sp.]
MKQDVLLEAEKYATAHQRKKRWYRVVTCLACVVVFCTVYALILPAITMVKDPCEIPEHTHNQTCYTQIASAARMKPVCTTQRLNLHRHNDSCRDSKGNLKCGYADFVVHQHNSSCYGGDGTLWCTLPEIEAHTHTQDCYAVPGAAAEEVHTHTDACYTLERGRLICTESTEPAHRHSDGCYMETPVLICGEDHEHGAGCYETRWDLTCGLTEEPTHQHTDACYKWEKVLTCDLPTELVEENPAEEGEPELVCEKKEIILHEHDADCFDEYDNLICGKLQILEHRHTNTCFETVDASAGTDTLTCTNTDEDHIHTALCYGTWELTCGLEEHTHSLACYSDANADVETAADWEQTFADVTLTGDWAQDVLAIAGTQLDYAESTKNYIVLPDGETMKGYTRYGDWYGQTVDDPNAMYGDWDAMFVSFCLHYARADTVLPLEADSASWVQALSDEEYDLYIPAPEAEPWPGDLIFFNREPELEEGAEPVADHVGLVAEVIPEEGDRPAQIKVIEGDASAEDGSPDAVRRVTYELDDETILGYAVIPANPGEEAALLSAGGIPDTLYLNIDSIDWGKDGARIVLAYKSTDNNGEWKFAEMTKESDKIYRIALPGNMDKTNSAFKFVRMDNSGNFSWDNKWSEASSQDLSLMQNKNCYKLTDWNAGQWEDSWYTPAGGTVTTLYLDLTQFTDNGGGWDQGGATFYLKYYNTSGAETSVQLTKQENETYYSVAIPADMDTSKSFKFERRNPGGSEVLHSASNLTLPTDGNDCYVITGWNDSGYWKKAETGGTVTTLYLDLSEFPDWENGGATFYLKYNIGGTEKREQLTNVGDKTYSITIPADMDTSKRFRFERRSSDGNAEWDYTSDLTLPTDGSDCYVITDWKNRGYWKKPETGGTGNTVTTLYLDLSKFPSWEEGSATFYLKYYNTSGTENSVQLTKQENEPYYSVAIPADMDTSGTIQFERRSSDGNTVLNFISDLTLLTNGSNRYIITDWAEGHWYGQETGETRTVYYDATLSKLSYNGDCGTNTIPKANGNSEGDKVYCHWKNSTSEGNVQMTRDHDDVYVYRADIPKDAVNVLFYSSSDGTAPSSGSNMTEEQGIPDTLKSPCFYGDTSDSAIYGNAKRSGYWGEVDTIRDAEAGKKSTVVDIAAGKQNKSNDVLYVNTTLYDYYTDYELNGNNRDGYAKNGVDWKTHRIYQPFRQFNQALSVYYQQNSASHPLYWGNFQNYSGSHYNDISGTLNLYGYDNNTKQFFAENNSMWGYDGNDVGNDGKQATQGLVDSTLRGGTLTMGGNAAPFFNESFLSGSNAKNTVLGKVYHNVSFPFVKKDINNNGVDYWCFDSSQTNMENSNLQLKQDGSRYFLQPTGSGVNGCTTGGQGGTGYFPFNTSSQSGEATQLNYGFGQRFDIQFRLTEDGTVTDSNGNKVSVEFNFSGDDDVWVFVDGYLVLDIGGDHGRVEGSINFKDRNSTVSRVKNSDAGTTANKVTSFPSELQSGDFYKSEHTLTMFYMERGLWESNMKITFNFPDENLLTVEKQVNTTNVNSLFQSLFNNKDLFTFHIKTMATHFGTKSASGETSQPVQISLNGNLSTGSSDITFDHTPEHAAVQEGTSEFIRWRCRVDDDDGSHRSARYGQLALSNPVSLSGQQYLQFDFWFDWNETPSLSKLFVDLRDGSGNSLTTEYLSVSSCVSGSPVMAQDQWITLKLDLDRMGVNRNGTVKYIRIGYDLGRNVYIRDMSFQPVTSVHSGQVGFVTPQNDIPDYGTASTGQLAIPVNAVYTSSRGPSYRIGTDGTFTLQNGETVTFHDQFRRGSYMYLEEDANPLYTTTWSMYEGMNQSPVSTSTVPSGATTVGGVEQNMSNISGRIVTDGRVEIASPVTDENDTSGNKYQNDRNSIAPGSTFVFRHYSDPDNTTTTTKLTVKFTNTVNTGSLTITKAQAEGSEDLGTQKFTFYVEFYNVGGMGLEGTGSILAGPYTIPVGGSQTIDGIPVGTNFTIHEVKPEDAEIVLDNVNGIRPGTGTVNGSTSYTVTGSIPTNGTAQSYTFYNSKKSVVSLNVRKEWISMQGNEMSQNLPTSISVQLQRSTDGETWASVPGYEKVTLAPGYTTWQQYSYTFRDLDRYASDKTTEYQYRVVELNSDGSAVEGTVTLDDRSFTVTYSDVTNSSENSAPPAYSQTITNTEQPTGYELPNTGGAGTVPYTMGGSLLLTGAAFLLLYNHTKRRKEDSPSS